MVNAGHPDYENAEGIDDLDVAPGTGGGGAFGDYPGVTMDSFLGVPFVIVNAIAKDSTTSNAKAGDQYVIMACEFIHDLPKKFAIPKAEDGDPIQVKPGAKFSVLTGGYYIVPKVLAMMAKRNLGEGVPFDPPFGPVMFSKRASDKSGKARDLVGVAG